MFHLPLVRLEILALALSRGFLQVTVFTQQ